MNRHAVILAVAVLALLSCAEEECDGSLELYSCPAPDIGHVNTKGTPAFALNWLMNKETLLGEQL